MPLFKIEESWFNSWLRNKIFLLSRPVLGPTQSPIKWVPRVKPWGMKLIVPFRTVVKNVWSCAFMT